MGRQGIIKNPDLYSNDILSSFQDIRQKFEIDPVQFSARGSVQSASVHRLYSGLTLSTLIHLMKVVVSLPVGMSTRRRQ